MSLKLSTGLRNFLAGEGTIRKAFEDAVLYVYGGTAPATVEEAPGTANLLYKVTKASDGVTAGDRSTSQLEKITIGHSGAPNAGDTVVLVLDGTTLTYVVLTADSSVTKVATKVARMLNDCAQVDAIATGADGVLYVQGRIAGVSFTLTEGSCTGWLSATVATQVTAAARANTIQFGAPNTGVLSKSADVWSGVATASGTATYFRLVTSSDGLDADANDMRIQGLVSTSGAECNMTNLNVVIGSTQTIETGFITIPAS